MKFIYADSLDYVDPNYIFSEDRSPPERQPYWDDQFPHEYLGQAPYDGVLVSRGIVGDHKFSGKYTQAQAMRFRRVGARKFLRLDSDKFKDLPIFGDCGAFSYHKLDEPPYTPGEMLEFYEDGGFTHGCSVDHIIFEFDPSLKGMELPDDTDVADRVQRRFEITLENAAKFFAESKNMGSYFTPLGVVQGWSPGSMAEAAKRLSQMGYTYIAIGGMVPLSADAIHIVMEQIQAAIPASTRLHILGFGKIDRVTEFFKYNLASVDTTSPMLKAFKDSRKNYFVFNGSGDLDYYTAIRIPQSHDNNTLKKLVKMGVYQAEKLASQEKAALNAVRKVDEGTMSTDEALKPILEYSEAFLTNARTGKKPGEKKLRSLETEYKKTLDSKPWKSCGCNVCQRVSVETIIFRASNRNKRRGIHNMWAFNNQLKMLSGSPVNE